jgi:DNA-binding NarL/FixJ family response regulator
MQVMTEAQEQQPSSGSRGGEAPIRIVIADSGSIRSQLLARALRSRHNFHVTVTPQDTAVLHHFLESDSTDIVLVPGTSGSELRFLRWLQVTHPAVAAILLVEECDRQLVVNAFRSGAKGIFQFDHDPFRLLCKCVNSVSQGQIWISTEHTHYVLDALSEVSTLRVVNAKGRMLLTPREQQVVALVAEGLNNREVAGELGLSEHTIKKYLLRIFDKLGISSRVELVLYAVFHGENRPAEWLPSN